MYLDNVRLAASALTNTVYIGKINKQGTAFSGEKKDVTSDFLKAIVDLYAGYEVDIKDEQGNNYVLTVKKVDNSHE